MESPRTRSVTGNTTQFEHICFICNVKRPCDQSHKYSEGGLGLCQFDSAANRLNNAADLIGKMHEYYPAKERLRILLSGSSKDIYSAEIRYHMSYYKRFTYCKGLSEQDEIRESKMHENALNDFLFKVDHSIVRNSKAYLLNELLNDWFSLCEDRNVTSKINHTHHLKREIKQRFPDSIGFFKTGRHVIVYSQLTNPCEYSINTLMGTGMRNEDIIRKRKETSTNLKTTG